MENEDQHECPWCEEEFKTEHKLGVHKSKEHVDPDETYETKKKRQHNPYKNLVEEWKEEGGGRA